jgi:hypothetical protein
MRDLKFGALSPAVKTTEVYSASTIDFGASDSRLSDTSIKTGEQHELTVVFNVEAALAAIDYLGTPKLQDSANNSDWATLAIGPDTAAAAAKGVICTFKMPKSHRRYVRAAITPQSSGTFTAVTVNAWLEPGPNT